MKLLTEKIKKQIPSLYSTEKTPLKEKLVICKFFNPCGAGTWYVIEGEKRGEDYLFWGLVDLAEREYGYFSLKELEAIQLPYGHRLERDQYFHPARVRELQ